MKQGLHPDNYRLVVFEDLNNGVQFLTKSTASAEETVKWEDGKEYPLIKVHISSASHPFFTGQEKLVDVEGRVDRFKARQEAAQKKQADRVKKAKKQSAKSESKAEPITQKVGGGSKQISKKVKVEGDKKDDGKKSKVEGKKHEDKVEAKKVEPQVEKTPKKEETVETKKPEAEKTETKADEPKAIDKQESPKKAEADK